MFEETEMLPSRKPIPNYLYMQRHVNRAELLADGINIKCFHRTDKVVINTFDKITKHYIDYLNI